MRLSVFTPTMPRQPGAVTLEELKEMAAHPRVVALGEMGLDYYRDLSPARYNREIFREQLALARELDLPIIIHDRDAHGDLPMKILRENRRSLQAALCTAIPGAGKWPGSVWPGTLHILRAP